MEISCGITSKSITDNLIKAIEDKNITAFTDTLKSAPLDAVSAKNNLVLRMASNAGQLDMVKALLNKHQLVISPVHFSQAVKWAMSEKHFEVVQELLNHHQKQQRENAFEFIHALLDIYTTALGRGFDHVAEMVWVNGGLNNRISARSSGLCRDAFIATCTSSSFIKDPAETLFALIPESQKSQALTDAFMAACGSGNEEAVNWIISQNSTIFDPGFNDNEAIISASRNGHTEIVKILLALPLNRFPTFNPGARGSFALVFALENKHFAIVDLLQEDPRVNSQEASNYALTWGDREALGLL